MMLFGIGAFAGAFLAGLAALAIICRHRAPDCLEFVGEHHREDTP